MELPVSYPKDRLHLWLCYTAITWLPCSHWDLDHTWDSFTHTPRPTGRGGGTGLVISRKWSFSLYLLPLFTPTSFEFHAVTVTHPVQWTIVVLSRPPGSLGDFLEELDVLLSNFPENSPPLILLGDFNIQTEKSSDLLLLLSSFALSLSPSPPTHKAGNHLDYIFTRNRSTSNLTVTPLHVSDHFFISYSLPLSQTGNPTTSTDSVPVRRNICSLYPASLASSVLSALPSTNSFSLMHPNSATDILLSTLSSSLDSLCPLTSRQVRKSSPAPWLSNSVRADRATMRASERKWWKSKHPDDLLTYQSLLSSFSAFISIAKSTFYQTTIQSSFSNPKKLFSIFSNLLDTPSHNQVLTLVTSARPTTCPLDLIPSHILQSIAPDLLPFLTHLINT